MFWLVLFCFIPPCPRSSAEQLLFIKKKKKAGWHCLSIPFVQLLIVSDVFKWWFSKKYNYYHYYYRLMQWWLVYHTCCTPKHLVLFVFFLDCWDWASATRGVSCCGLFILFYLILFWGEGHRLDAEGQCWSPPPPKCAHPESTQAATRDHTVKCEMYVL